MRTTEGAKKRKRMWIVFEPEEPILKIIDRYRRGICMSVPELCEKAHITTSSYYHWMEGKTSPTLDSLKTVLGAMGLELSVKKTKGQRQPHEH